MISRIFLSFVLNTSLVPLSISVIIPVKNEGRNITVLASEICELAGNDAQLNIGQVIFVDDNSQDDTSEQIKLSSSRFSLVKGISLNGVEGKGAAIKAGIREAAGDIVVIMDGDLQHSPHWIGSLVKPIVENESDVVVAARGGENYSLYRRFLSKIFSRIFNTLFKLDLSSPNEGFKAFRRVDALSLEVNANGFDFDIEFLVRANRAQLKISETPIVLRKRLYGCSKVYTSKVAASFLYRMMRLWLEQKKSSVLR